MSKIYLQGEVLTAADLNQSFLDLKTLPINPQTSTYTLVVDDLGKVISATGSINIPANVFASGSTVSIFNNSGAVINIIQASGLTLYNASTSVAGSFTLNSRGICSVIFVDTTTAVLTGVGVSVTASGTLQGPVGPAGSFATISAGSAAAPSIAPAADTNTGIFFPAADTVGIATGGTERVRVDSAGQIGIGGANYGTSGQVLTSGGASAAPSWTTVSGSGSGGPIRAPQVLTGTSYTTPAGCTLIIVEMWGGGGGGGSGASGGGNATNCAGGGGGGGGFLRQAITVSPSTSYEIAVGAGGAGGAGLGSSDGRVGNNGTAGGTTSIKVGATTYSAFGGGAGNRGPYHAGGNPTTNAAPAAGGATSGVSPILAMTGGASQSPDTTQTSGGLNGDIGWDGGAAFGGHMTQGGGLYTETPATVVAFGCGGGGSIGNSGANPVLAGATGGSGRFIVTEYS